MNAETESLGGRTLRLPLFTIVPVLRLAEALFCMVLTLIALILALKMSHPSVNVDWALVLIGILSLFGAVTLAVFRWKIRKLKELERKTV